MEKDLLPQRLWLKYFTLADFAKPYDHVNTLARVLEVNHGWRGPEA